MAEASGPALLERAIACPRADLEPAASMGRSAPAPRVRRTAIVSAAIQPRTRPFLRSTIVNVWTPKWRCRDARRNLPPRRVSLPNV